MPSPRAACRVVARTNVWSVAASVTTFCWMADSSAFENANVPIGSIESPNCSSRIVRAIVAVAPVGDVVAVSDRVVGVFVRGGRAEQPTRLVGREVRDDLGRRARTRR